VSDAATAKLAGTEALAAKFPFNAAKPSEFGAPPVAATGNSFKPSDPSVSGSTLSESNASAKLGSGIPTVGSNPTTASLDRVRVDS
jgi:catalase